MLKTINRWQNAKFLWILMIIVTVGLTAIAHYFFQDYLFMEPCEQCVYIRFAMLTMALGGVIAIIYPHNATKILAYSLAFYGCIVGIEFCLTLNQIHTAVHSENPFGGVEGCREIPIYPFALPLHELAPSWFLPTGECGLDAPVIPEDIYSSLSKLQQIFVGSEQNDFEDGLYSNGWYLIPSMKFMNMAIACLLCFVCCLIALVIMFLGFVFGSDCKWAKIGGGLVLLLVIALYFTGNITKQKHIEQMSNENTIEQRL